MDDINFEKIHFLLKLKKYEYAKTLLLNADSSTLNAPYFKNPNHAWYLLGSIAYDCGDYVEALNSYNKSYESDHKDAIALMAIANCYSELGDFTFVEQTLKKALQLDELDRDLKIKILYNLGNVLFDKKKYTDAIGFYEKVANQRGEIAQKAKKNLVLSKKLSLKNKK